MHSIVRNILRGAAAKDIAKLASGAAAGQAVVLLSSPILTRLYQVDAFGLFGTYSAISTSIGLVASLKYEQAIVLSGDDREAGDVLRLTVVTSLVVALLSTLAAACARFLLIDQLWKQVADLMLLGGGLSIFCLGSLNGFNFWFTRTREFGVIGRFQVARAVIGVLFQMAFCLEGATGFWLSAGQVTGLVLAAALLVGWYRSTFLPLIATGYRVGSLMRVARRYRSFPFYGAPQTIGRLVSVNIPALLFPAFFGATEAGLFWLAYRTLIMPSLIISESVRSVFFRHAAQLKRDGGNMRSPVLRTALAMGGLSIPVVLILAVWGGEIFSLIFGQQWTRSGEYAFLLAIGWAFENAMLSGAAVLAVLERQRVALIIEVFSVGLRALGIVTGYFFGSVFCAVALFSAAAIFNSLLVLSFGFWLSPGTAKKWGNE